MLQKVWVLFDYDGTVAKREYTYKCFEKFNQSKILRERANEMVKAYTEGKILRFLEPMTYMPLLYCLRGVREEEIKDYVSKTTRENLVEGIEDVVKKLKEMGVKVGIVSENIQFQPRYAAEYLGVNIFCSNEVEVKEGKITGKVSKFSRKKEMIKRIAEQNPNYEIIYVGDDADPYDFVKCVLFNPKRKSDLKKVDNKKCFLIEDYSQLLTLLESLKAK